MRALRAGWWIIPLVLVATLGSVSYLTAGERPPSYVAASTLAVIPNASVPNDSQVLRSLELLERGTMLLTLSRISESDAVRTKAAERMGTPLESLLGYGVQGSVLPGSHMIRISVSGPDPGIVERLARAVAAIAETETTVYYPVFALRPLESVEPPSAPVDSGERRLYAVAGVLGLFIGMGGAYGVGVLRST